MHPLFQLPPCSIGEQAYHIEGLSTQDLEYPPKAFPTLREGEIKTGISNYEEKLETMEMKKDRKEELNLR